MNKISFNSRFLRRGLTSILGMLAVVVAFTACSPDDFNGADPNGVPSISDAQYHVDVDQNTNLVTFTLDTPGMYPIWTINGSPVVKTTVNGYQKKFIFKGTYDFTLKVGNRNGVSDGEVSGTFTVDSTRYDFSTLIAHLTGGGTKEWRISSKDKGHLACGPDGTDGKDWWSAGADEKSANSIYDDRITFSADNKYTYSAGDDGMTFCNAGVTTLGVTGAGGDYDIPVVGQFGTQAEAEYSFGYDDAHGQETITLPAKTLFPYMANDAQMQGSYTFRVLDCNDKKLELVYDVPGVISWHLMFINGEDEAPSQDFDPDKVNWADVNSDLNLAKELNTKGAMTFWWADAGWAQIADPTFSYENGVYTITADNATVAQWQAQCSILSDGVVMEAGQAYDLAVTIEASESFDNATIKFCDQADGDNPTLVYAEKQALKKGKNVFRFAKRYPKTGEADAAGTKAKFIIDLGGCPAGLQVKISNIILQKHNPK